MVHSVTALSAPAEDASLTQGGRSDPDPFDTLYQRYRDCIYAYLRSRTTTDEDAADLTQLVFVRAIDALHRSRTQQEMIGAWLFRIARNAAVDFHRRHRTTIPWDLVPVALQPTVAENPAKRMIAQESLLRLRELFVALNAESRELLTLRFAGQLTAPEIAAVIGISEAATRKRLTRLLQSLKERYDEPSH